MARCLNCMKEYDENFGVCPHCGYVPGSAPKEPFELPPGVILNGRYLIGTEVGVGGFGITYRAWDLTLNQMVAIKEFYPSANGIVNRNPGEQKIIVYSGRRATEFVNGLKRFLLEARNMAKFSTHPNIVHVYDFFEANGTAYISMEFLEGISYKQFIASNDGKIDVQTACNVTYSLLDALKEIHSVGIIHRDISPDNIFICDNGLIKLIDFGAARFSTGEQESQLTIILKPGYAPPEQYLSRSKQGAWTDIYAAGAMLYRAITGRMPDESTNRQAKDELPSPHEIDPQIPESVSNAVMRAMAVNQELRFRNVEQFREALKSATPVRNVEDELKHRKGFRLAVVGGAAACILAGIGIGGFVYMQKQNRLKLKEAEIAVWYPQAEERGDGLFDMEGMVTSYLDDNQKVSIRLRGIPASEYEKELRNAIESGNAPTVFDSSCLNGDYADRFAEVDDKYGFLKQKSWVKDYCFLDSYSSLFPQHKVMPMTFDVPVIYVDTQLVENAPAAITSLDEFISLVGSGAGYAVDPDARALYDGLDVELDDLYTYDDFVTESGEEMDTTADIDEQRQKMLEGKVGFYLSDSSAYSKVQEDMGGVYSMVFLKDLPVRGRFGEFWSVSAEGSKAEQEAGVRFLYYLLSGENQQVFAFENDCGLPLNRDVLKDYENNNDEFAGLSDTLKGLTMIGE